MADRNQDVPGYEFHHIPFNAPLDQSLNKNRLDPAGFVNAVNVIYRPFNSVSKRPGYGAYGSAPAAVAVGHPVVSGKRFYAAIPSVIKRMVVQSNNALYYGNDSTGAWTSIGALTAGALPAFFSAAHDPAESGVAGTPAADILIIAYGSASPLKWDGTNLTTLSSTITNLFTGTEFFHDHTWFWGDPNNPNSIFATDLGNPEGFTFMNTFNPPGYGIGQGDGDPNVTRCIANGATLYVFKESSIYGVTGYGFQIGEYQFQVTPLVTGSGTTAPFSPAVLQGSIIYWDGSQFMRLFPGSSQPFPIGIPIINTMASAAVGNPAVFRAVAGSFAIVGLGGTPVLLTNAYICAVDIGNGVADTLLVYDDDASQLYGKPAWTIWTQYTTGCFIPWGNSGDFKRLYVGDGTVASGVVQFGGQATSDFGIAAPSTPIAIQTELTTGRWDFGTPNAKKRVDRIYAEIEANQAQFQCYTYSDIQNIVPSNLPTYFNTVTGPGGGAAIVGTLVLGGAGEPPIGPAASTLYQSILGDVHHVLPGHNIQFDIFENSATSSWSFQGLGVSLDREARLR